MLQKSLCCQLSHFSWLLNLFMNHLNDDNGAGLIHVMCLWLLKGFSAWFKTQLLLVFGCWCREGKWILLSGRHSGVLTSLLIRVRWTYLCMLRSANIAVNAPVCFFSSEGRRSGLARFDFSKNFIAILRGSLLDFLFSFILGFWLVDSYGRLTWVASNLVENITGWFQLSESQTAEDDQEIKYPTKWLP